MSTAAVAFRWPAWHNARAVADADRPPPVLWALIAFTVVSGLVDAVSYLGLGHVFTANMTGNIVILGFAAAGGPGFSVLASLTSLGCFLAGETNPKVGRRAASVVAMVGGAFVGAVLFLHQGAAWPLAVVAVVVLGDALLFARSGSSHLLDGAA